LRELTQSFFSLSPSVAREVASSLVLLLNGGYLLVLTWMAIGPAVKENAKKVWVLFKKISNKLFGKVKTVKKKVTKKVRKIKTAYANDDDGGVDVAELEGL